MTPMTILVKVAVAMGGVKSVIIKIILALSAILTKVRNSWD